MCRRIWVNERMTKRYQMKLISRGLLCALLVGGVLMAANAAALTSQQLFARFGERVVQVRILDRSTGLKSAFGSGFVVSDKGLVATNYHVVSEMVMEPDDFRAEYQHENGTSGELRLVTVDVVNDLALLQAEALNAEPLSLSTRHLRQGEELHALGNPFDLGLTIVSGTYNGFQEKSLYERIHFTGSINPGMSGGPALDNDGRVVGINVATAGNQVSFLIPVDKLRRLIDVAGAQESPADPLAEIREQLLRNQQRYYQQLLSGPFPRIALGDYSLPGELADYVHCWGHSRNKEEKLYEMSFQACTTQDELFLSEDLSIGRISFRHQLFRSTGLDRFRFYNLLERQAERSGFSFGGEEEDLSRFTCTTSLLEKGPLTFKLLMCLRGYKRFEGLYDLHVSAFTVNEPLQSLHTSLSLTGVSKQNARDFLESYLEGVTWRTTP